MEKKKYVMALDQGTTSSRCILFDRQGHICSVSQREFPQIYPQPGWVEHDPEVIWETQYDVMQGAMNKLGVTSEDIAAIGITNQRETTLYGTVIQASRFTMPLFGSAGEQHRLLSRLKSTVWVITFGKRQGLCRMLIFQERRLNGFLTMLRVQGNRRSEANYCLERLIHGLYGN